MNRKKAAKSTKRGKIHSPPSPNEEIARLRPKRPTAAEKEGRIRRDPPDIGAFVMEQAPKLKQPPASERLAAATQKKRSTAAEKEARVSTVMTMLLSGARRIEIVQFAAKTWGVEDRQSDTYIAEATALIKANADKTREEEIVEHIGRMDLVFRSAMRTSHYTDAISAAKDKAKLRGLYPDQRVKLLSWQDEIVDLLRLGKVTAEDVYCEFGETDEIKRIIETAGLSAEGGATESEGGEESAAHNV